MLRLSSLRRLAAFALVLAVGCGGEPTSGGSRVDQIVLEPEGPSISVGESVSLRATLLDAEGRPLAGRAIVWASGNNGVAEISSAGVVTGVQPGLAQVAASAEGQHALTTVTVRARGIASIEVTPPSVTLEVGQSRAFRATLRDAVGTELQGRTVTWSSNDESVAAVGSDGSVTARAPGVAVITATSEGRSAGAAVAVQAIPVASVSLSPATLSLTVGQTASISATTRSGAGSPLAGRLVSWSTSAPSVATVSSQGLVTASGVGQAIITGESEGRSATVNVSVSPIPAASVVVSPASVSLTVGGTQSLSASVTDGSGAVLTNRPISWSSVNTSVATVSVSGVVTAIAPGSAQIRATSEGRTGTATVTVSEVPVATVTLSPATMELVAGQSQRLTAVVRSASGAALAGRVITWSSNATNVATVSSDGTVNAVEPGSAVITGTSEGVGGTAVVTVRAVPVASVSVSPSSGTLTVGGELQLSAQPRDAAGNALGGRSVAWSSNAPGVALVSNQGRVVAVGPGTALISATSEGRTGSATITVQQGGVVTVSVTPTSATVAVGGTTTLSATGRSSSGATVPNRPVTWQSNNEAIARVNGTGQVTGVGPGSATITATIDGVSGSSTVTVTGPPPVEVGSVRLTPRQLNISVGQTRQLDVSVTSASGGSLPNYPVVFTSSNTQVATVSSAGVVTGVGEGSATIRANAGGKIDEVGVTVRR